MKIVIDIPKEMYQKIKETAMVISGRRNGERIDYILFNAVINGKTLEDYSRAFDAIDYAETMVEADKEGET